MTFKPYLILMTVGTMIALSAWSIVFLAIDPVSSGWVAKLAFYITFFASSVGILALLGAMIRVFILHRDQVVSREVARAFRQSLFFSGIILFGLILSATNYLHWWLMVLVILLFACLELFFITFQGRSK